ncbi:hypothetical protein G3576_30755 [Roseomonas stagni]|uniref:Uncharacterized protein n=1 Tax=Falsiroseomonas algicola TaxID=2716930 RepID=A0A6M1LVA7_9PROT|nr:hypothetical protein [Falsiroseomonas algicola]NGM24398.1 hypothetical protein [Falsiroseomonas algicola]
MMNDADRTSRECGGSLNVNASNTRRRPIIGREQWRLRMPPAPATLEDALARVKLRVELAAAMKSDCSVVGQKRRKVYAALRLPAGDLYSLVVAAQVADGEQRSAVENLRVAANLAHGAEISDHVDGLLNMTVERVWGRPRWSGQRKVLAAVLACGAATEAVEAAMRIAATAKDPSGLRPTFYPTYVAKRTMALPPRRAR